MTHVEYLKEIILDYQELIFPRGIPRRVSISSISGKPGIIDVVPVWRFLLSLPSV